MMQTLQEIYRKHTGKVSDKWGLYLNEYDRLFQPYRDQPVRLLEIGIQNGGSLEIWAKYFAQAKALIGCDINPDCAYLQYEDQRIHVIVGDANAATSRQAVQSITMKLDLLVDDGSHVSRDIIESFLHYFPMLEDGGLYVAEDLHCSYWQEFDGGLFDPASSIAFFKALADIINYEHWGIRQSRQYVLFGLAAKYGLNFASAELEKIHSVEFVNSICVIRKQPAAGNQLGCRQVVGQLELVVGGHSLVGGTLSIPPRQEGRERSISLEVELTHVRAQLESTRMALDASEHLVNSLVASKSWKLTYPLRWLYLQARKTKAVWRKLDRLMKSSGGTASVLHKVLRIYRQEGFAGVTARLRRLHHIAMTGSFDRNNYIEWVSRYDTMSDATRQTISERIAEMVSPPLISVVMPTYNPNLQWLEEAIASVRNQLYPHWQLCIADDASADPQVRSLLTRLASEDDRIKIVFRPVNGHISAASNSALELATGEWVALLDHDDLLTEHALYYVACAIVDHPDVSLIYSDEDKIDAEGIRSGPYFKTDWNEDLFYSHNMICHLGAYRRSLLQQVGGFRLGYEGAQDYDLALRCIEQIDRKAIHHIPRVLYHWRVHAGSTAGDADAKPYAMLAGERAINEHFERMCVSGRVALTGYGYRATYDLPIELPKVSIVIPTRNGLSLVQQCVNSILEKTQYTNYEILIIDNGSDDQDAVMYFESLSVSGTAIVIRDDREFNYSALNNLAVSHATGEIVCLLNNDIEVITPAWLCEMVAHALRPGVGAVGAKLLYPNDTIQHAGVVCGIGGWAGHSHKGFPRSSAGYSGRTGLISNFSAVTGACLVMRKSLYLDLGGLNEQYLKVAGNDVDLCLRALEAGYRNVWTPYAELYHHESATRGYEDNPEKQARFAAEVRYMVESWGDMLLVDPYYNPNLTLDHEDFSLAWPPRVSSAT